MRDFKRGFARELGNKKESDSKCRRVGDETRPINVAVVVRQQAPEEERRTTAAIELLLAEMVRQQLGCQGERK